MKYYILSTIERIKQYSGQLDAESILYNRSWEVLNEENSKEVFIFRPNNELLLSINGKVQRGRWELLPNRSLLIDINNETYLLRPQFVNNQYLSLQLSGNEGSLILIDEDVKEQLLLNTVQALEQHLLSIYQKEEEMPEEQPEDKEEHAGEYFMGCLIIVSVFVILGFLIITQS
ncbi:hypothetical protein [Bacteroides sp. 51]|uniref:hypothetical protein n=1 Tax=Bacteroides sp. 51 TaxID=2302938 RepID=UPI0013D3E5E6|nr:hypothetical protein [Bacteroides sp. 51]NDV84107.1 hypothetical protein [Bacteroides sp. 51]